VVTGGLGPSYDDLTVKALSKVTDKKVIYDERALEMLKERCNKFSIDLSDSRKRMTRLVEGAEPLENLVGLAPGMKITIGNTCIFALPGVPKEMRPMFNNFVRPLISKTTWKRSVAMTLHIFMPRYSIFPILNRVRTLFSDAYIKSHSTPPTNHEKNLGLDNGLKVDIVVWGENQNRGQTQLDKIRFKITELVEEQGGQVIIEYREKSS
jgi:molybdopterin-biosynthesis enzyme MoeA-like protein